MIRSRAATIAGIAVASWMRCAAATLGSQQEASVTAKAQAPTGWGEVRFGMTPQEIAAIFKKKAPKKFERPKGTGTIKWSWHELPSDENCTPANGLLVRSIAGAAFTADAVTQALTEITYFPNGCRTAQPGLGPSMIRQMAGIFARRYGPPTLRGEKSTWTLPGVYIEVFPDYYKSYSGRRPGEYLVGVTIRKLDN